jgi:hypothetical protein
MPKYGRIRAPGLDFSTGHPKWIFTDYDPAERVILSLLVRLYHDPPPGPCGVICGRFEIVLLGASSDISASQRAASRNTGVSTLAERSPFG